MRITGRQPGRGWERPCSWERRAAASAPQAQSLPLLQDLEGEGNAKLAAQSLKL